MNLTVLLSILLLYSATTKTFGKDNEQDDLLTRFRRQINYKRVYNVVTWAKRFLTPKTAEAPIAQLPPSFGSPLSAMGPHVALKQTLSRYQPRSGGRRWRPPRPRILRRFGGPGVVEGGLIPGIGGGRLAPGLNPSFDPFKLKGMGNPFEPRPSQSFQEYSRNIQNKLTQFAFPNRNVRLGVTYVYGSGSAENEE